VIQLAQLLGVTALAALALALSIVLRQAGRLIAATRQIEGFRRSVADLAARIDTSLAGVATLIDGVRRRTIEAESIGDNLAAASDAVERYAAEARGLHGPPGSNDIRDAIVDELDRAGRALQMVEHGCSILTSARVRGRELEAQTAIKRGYLNVLHAREAIGRHAARAASFDATHRPAGMFERRNA